MGQQHLRAVDFAQQQSLPGRVQVCQHVIKEHNRPLAELFPEEIHLGQSETECHGVMLAARPERSRVDAVQRELEVIAMGANLGRAAPPGPTLPPRRVGLQP